MAGFLNFTGVIWGISTSLVLFGRIFKLHWCYLGDFNFTVMFGRIFKLHRALITGEPEAQGLSKSTLGPSDFTRLQLIGPVLNKLCVCFSTSIRIKNTVPVELVVAAVTRNFCPNIV